MNNFTRNPAEIQLSSPLLQPGVLRDVRSEDTGCRDLTSIKQSYKRNRYIVFSNYQTGQMAIIDTVKNRYNRMVNRIKSWAELINGVEGNKRLVMVGLTYRPGEEWNPNDIREFMSKVKRKLGEKLLGYAWVSELQERGAIHYHVLMYFKKGTRFPLPDKSGWWKHGSSSVTSAKSPWYVLSYTKKAYQKNYEFFPSGARAFAVWIQDSLLSEKLRFVSLKNWERAAVMSDGWESLSFWRKHHSACNNWRLDRYYSSLDEAEYRTEYMLGIFEELGLVESVKPDLSERSVDTA